MTGHLSKKGKRLCSLVWAAVLCVGLLAPRESQAAGYQMSVTFTGYTGRAEILTNFPALIVLSNGVGGSGFDYSKFVDPTNGYDLRIRDAADTTNLDYEIDTWVATIAAATNISGCALWLKADAGALTNASGAVTNWLDQSGNGNHATTTNAGPKVANNGIAGASTVIQFDGVANYFETAYTSSLSCTIFTVFKQTNNASGKDGPLWQTKPSASYSGFIPRLSDNNQFIAKSDSAWLSKASAFALNSSYITAVVYDNAAPATRLYSNGMLNDSAASTPTSAPEAFTIGRRLVPSVLYFCGEIAEIIVYNRVLSGDEMTRVNAYLSQKYAVFAAPYASQIWVRVPELATNGVGSILLKWGDEAMADRLPCTTNGAVWESSYRGVWHLNQSSGSISDSTTNRTSGTDNGSVTRNANGVAGVCCDFDGGNDYFNLGTTTALDLQSANYYTLSVWVWTDTGPDNESVAVISDGFSASDSRVQYALGMEMDGNSTSSKPATGIYNGSWNKAQSSSALALNRWVHLVGTWDRSKLRIYVDGVEVANASGATLPPPATGTREPTYIGRRHDTTAECYFDGLLDEARIEAVARSSNWVWACYMNQSSPGAFNRYGPAEPQTVVAGAPKIANFAVQGLTTNSADLVGYLSTGTAAAVTCYWGTNDGNGVASQWQTNTPMGTSSAPAYVTNFLTGLIPNTSYSCQYYATNSAGEWWGTGARGFTTLGPPAVNNDAGATNKTPVSALLRGTVTAGTPAPEVVICLKKTSAGSAGSPSDTSTWDRVIGMGAQSGAFSNTVTGLDPDSTYYYQCLATNSIAAIWAPTAANFATTPLQPFNLASNHLVNGGGTLYATNPLATLPAAAGWLYDFASIGCTNLNMGTYRIATDNGESFTLNLGGGPIVNGGDLKIARSSDGANGSITISNSSSISVNSIRTDRTGVGAAGSITVRQAGSFSATQTVSTAGQLYVGGAQDFKGDDTGSFAVTNGGILTQTYRALCGSLTINDYSSVTVIGGIKTGPYTAHADGTSGAISIGQAGNRIGGAVNVSGGLDAGHTAGPSALVQIYAAGGVTITNGGISTRAGYGSGQGLTVDTTGGGISIGGDLLAGSTSGGNNGGAITLSAGGDITVSGSVNSDAPSAANEGDVTLIATNGIIDLAALDTNIVRIARLTPLKYTYIQTLTGAPGTDLRTDAGKKVFYGGGGTTITQLNQTNGAANGGHLVPGFGNMTADNSNDAGTFGTQLSATVRDATFNVGYDGLRGMVTNTTGSGGAGSVGTMATILYGGASATPTAMTMAWRTRTTFETNTLGSDVVSLGGTTNDVYVLRMDYSEAAVVALNKGSEADLAAANQLSLLRHNGLTWVNAGAGTSLGAYANQTTVGDWGVDTNANVAWVVLNQTGYFAAGVQLTVAGGAPEIVNIGLANLTTNSVGLVGYLSTGTPPVTVTCYWGTNNGNGVFSQWQTNTPGSTPSAPAYVTNTVTGLVPNTLYYYQYYATNDFGDWWGTGPNSFTTLGAPAVNNDAGATNRTATSALLRGTVTAGTPAPGAFFCLNKDFAGSAGSLADTGTWDWVIAAGAPSGAFSNTVTGLDPASTYYYQCLATNSTAAVWASTAASFSTLPFQPFNLASNHLVNGGATLYATNPAATLPATAGWLYEFEPMGYTNLNMGAYRIATDNGESFTLNLGGGPIVNGGELKTSRTNDGNTGSITITNAGSISLGTLMTSRTGVGAAGGITVRQAGSFSATQVVTVANQGNGGSQTFRGDDTGSFVVAPGGIQTRTAYNTCGLLTIDDYGGVSVTGGIRTGPTTGSINIGSGSVSIGQSSNRIGGAVSVDGGIVAENTGGSSAPVQIYATGGVTITGGGISVLAGGSAGSGQPITVEATGGSIGIGGDLLASSTTSGQNGGAIALSAGGDIAVSGAVNSDATSAANEGDVTLSATNGIVDLAALDTNTFKIARLAPLKYTYIQTLTGAPGSDLRTDAGKKVFYGGGGTTITQLNQTNGAANGGHLVPGLGNMTADNSNDAGMFGTQLSATVRDASFNVGYDGLRGMVTNVTGSGGAGSLGTMATILYGSASATPTAMTMAWRTRTTGETNSLVSDAVTLGGTGTDTYVLRMSYSEAAVAALNRGAEADLAAAGVLRPHRYSGSDWLKAGVGANQGAYANQTTVGNWGVDPAANVAWVVLNQPGLFAVGGARGASGTMCLFQ